MARKPLINIDSIKNGVISDVEQTKKDEKLTELVNNYIEAKRNADKYKKQADAINSEIKTIMLKDNLTSIDGDDAAVNLSITETKSFDEVPMMAWMKKRKVAHWTIRTKEYIDTDLLEEAIYTGKVDDIDLVKLKEFEIIKKTPKLTISKKKGE